MAAKTRLVALAASATIAALSSIAAAYVQPQPVRYGAQTQATAEEVTLEESVEVTCVVHGVFLSCEGAADQVFENTSKGDTQIWLETDEHTDQLLIDGTPQQLPAPIASGERQWKDPVTIQKGGRVAVHTHVATFALRGDSAPGDLHRWAVNARHPIVADYPGEGTPIALYVKGSDSDRLPNIRKRTITLRVPASWQCEYDSALVKEALKGGVRTLSRLSPIANDEFSITATMRRGSRWLVNGGPLLAIGYGGEHGPGDWTGAGRVRFGLEVGLDSWFLLGLTGETIGTHRSNAALEFVGATPIIPKVPALPSFALGVGMPVTMTRTPYLGLRMQTDVTWRLGMISLGAHFHADRYFAAHQWSLAPMLQIGM